MTTKLDSEIEALKLENIALRERIMKVEGANNVLSKRILGAIAIIEQSNEQRDARISSIEISATNSALEFKSGVVEAVRDANRRNIRI